MGDELSVCEARVSRRSSVSTSSRAATKNSTRWRVASRISSRPRTFCGSVIATRRLLPSNANGIAHTCSSTWRGTALLSIGIDVRDRQIDQIHVVPLGERTGVTERACGAVVDRKAGRAGEAPGTDSSAFGAGVSGSTRSVMIGSTYKIPR